MYVTLEMNFPPDRGYEIVFYFLFFFIQLHYLKLCYNFNPLKSVGCCFNDSALID